MNTHIFAKFIYKYILKNLNIFEYSYIFEYFNWFHFFIHRFSLYICLQSCKLSQSKSETNTNMNITPCHCKSVCTRPNLTLASGRFPMLTVRHHNTRQGQTWNLSQTLHGHILSVFFLPQNIE